MNKIALLIGIGVSSVALAGATQSSFTPTAYQYPITKISLFKADSTGEQVLYQCAGATSDDCLIDVTSDSSIQTIEDAAASVQLEPGTYTSLHLASCPAGTSGSDVMNVKVQGSVQLSAGLFTTNETAVGGMVLAGTPELATIPLGCGGAVVNLIAPLVVTAGSSQTLTLLIDLTHVTWTDANAVNIGGCRTDNGAGQDLCTTFPFIVPYLGSGTPTFERYLISHLSGAGTPLLVDANASVSFAVDSDNSVFYVEGAPYYSETSPSSYDAAKGGPDYFASTRVFSTNSDGSIAFQTGGSVEDNRVGFTAFQRNTHTGTCKNEEPASPVWNYQAFKE
jgi:hypothetical protein